jgi:hypothetical protein
MGLFIPLRLSSSDFNGKDLQLQREVFSEDRLPKSYRSHGQPSSRPPLRAAA